MLVVNVTDLSGFNYGFCKLQFYLTAPCTKHFTKKLNTIVLFLQQKLSYRSQKYVWLVIISAMNF